MNSLPEGQVAQTTQRGDGHAGRGGRGRGGANRATQKATVAKATLAKIGPTRLLEVEWTKDSLLKENCFIFWIGSGNAGNQQWVVHHPIGDTDLGDDEWVMTPSRDLGFLLSRRTSEELASWNRKVELAKRQEVLAARKGRGLDGQTEVWTFDGAPAIQPTIRLCMAAAKAAGKPESEWLNHADSAVQLAERTFKDACAKQVVSRTWFAENPRPKHKTMGGPLGDIPQKAVEYLDTLSFSSAKDKVLRVVLGLDSNEKKPDTKKDAAKPPPPAKQATKAASAPTSPKGSGKEASA